MATYFWQRLVGWLVEENLFDLYCYLLASYYRPHHIVILIITLCCSFKKKDLSLPTVRSRLLPTTSLSNKS